MQQRRSPLAQFTRSCAPGRCSFVLTVSLLCLGLFTAPATAQSEEKSTPVGPSSLQEVYHDWIVTCRKGSDQPDSPASLCQMAQELRDKKTGQLILSLVLPAQQLPDGANAVVVAPFGLNLSEGVTLSMLEQYPSDDANNESGFSARAIDPKIHAPFRTCLPSGCLSNFALNADMKKAMRAGNHALVSLISIDQNRTINVPLSLRGFTAAEQRLNALGKEFD